MSERCRIDITLSKGHPVVITLDRSGRDVLLQNLARDLEKYEYVTIGTRQGDVILRAVNVVSVVPYDIHEIPSPPPRRTWLDIIAEWGLVGLLTRKRHA